MGSSRGRERARKRTRKAIRRRRTVAARERDVVAALETAVTSPPSPLCMQDEGSDGVIGVCPDVCLPVTPSAYLGPSTPSSQETLDSPQPHHRTPPVRVYASAKRPRPASLAARFDSTSDEELAELGIELDSEMTQSPQVQGNRVVDLMWVLEQHEKVLLHPSCCSAGGRMQVVKEVRRGLVSVLVFKCSLCGKAEAVTTARPDRRLSANVALVCGAMSAGVDRALTEVILAHLEVPGPSPKTYRKCEKQVGEILRSELLEKANVAIEEEKRLAVERGHVDNGMPFISVVLDGAWNKKCSQNKDRANRGAAAIIGVRTKKLLYAVADESEFCETCARHKGDSAVPDHECSPAFTFRGSQSPSVVAVENLVQGITELYEVHNVWCKFLLGDGNSKMHLVVRDRAPRGDEVRVFHQSPTKLLGRKVLCSLRQAYL